VKLEWHIERLLPLPADQARREGMAIVKELREGLNRGEFRAAEKTADGWKTNVWVKRGILLAFKSNEEFCSPSSAV
jgi:hypothetical protein